MGRCAWPSSTPIGPGGLSRRRSWTPCEGSPTGKGSRPNADPGSKRPPGTSQGLQARTGPAAMLARRMQRAGLHRDTASRDRQASLLALPPTRFAKSAPGHGHREEEGPETLNNDAVEGEATVHDV